MISIIKFWSNVLNLQCDSCKQKLQYSKKPLNKITKKLRITENSFVMLRKQTMNTTYITFWEKTYRTGVEYLIYISLSKDLQDLM